MRTLSTGRFSNLLVGGNQVSWVELEDGTISTATTSVDVMFNPAGFSQIKLFITDIGVGLDNSILRIKAFNGGVIQTGATDYTFSINQQTGAGGSNQTATDAVEHITIAESLGTATHEICQAEITLYEPSTTDWKFFRVNSVLTDSSAAAFRSYEGGGCLQTASPVDGIRFFIETGGIGDDINYARYKLLGLRE